jgi:hypothetical protein
VGADWVGALGDVDAVGVALFPPALGAAAHAIVRAATTLASAGPIFGGLTDRSR